jgi:hypothetical protein
MNNRLINILSISFAALFITQVGHEATHGIVANLVGAKWTQFNLFFVDHQWPGEVNLTGELIIKSSAAILNIIVGLLAAYLFNRNPSASNWTRRLFLFYLAAYNTFTGFGYLFTDPLFYQPGGENLGDWKQIVDMLGGGWNVRLPISLVGAAGTLWMFFWIGRNAHAFLTGERMKSAIYLLLVPYLVWNITMVVFSLFLPYPELSVIVAIHGFFGYFGIFWGTFMAGKWIDPHANLVRTPLPDTLEPVWAICALLLIAIAAFVLLPTLNFI